MPLPRIQHYYTDAERKRLKRRAAATSDDVSDQDSGAHASGSEDDPNTALVQYQQNPDLVAMLRSFPAITEVSSCWQVEWGIACSLDLKVGS